MTYVPSYNRFLRALFRQITPTGTRTIYVSGSGSDGNDGLTVGTPLRQINTALASAQPGDLILVDDGTYAYVSVYGVNGTAQNWVTVIAQPGASAQVNVADNSGNDGIDIQQSSFVGFYGLEIVGLQTSTNTNPSGIGIFRGSHHIRCWANLIHDFPGGGINCFWVDTTVFGGSTLPAGSWDLVDVAFNTIHDCCRFSPSNTSGISFFGAIDMTQSTWDGTYAYRAIGNYIYDCECTVPFTSGGFTFVTDGNGISVDSLWVPTIVGIVPYAKQGLIEGNVVVGCGGRALHVFNSINVDDNFNTYVGNLRTSSPAITGGVETDAQYSPALGIGNGVTHYGNIIYPVNTPNSTDTVSTYTGNVILGGSQPVAPGNTDRKSVSTKYFLGPLNAADLPVKRYAPVLADSATRQARASGYQALGAGGRAPSSWQAGALEPASPGLVLV